MTKKRQLRCSFCLKNETDVLKLVAGPQVYICDACVAIAKRLMESDSHDDTQQEKVERSVWRKLLANARKLLRAVNARRVLAASDGF